MRKFPILYKKDNKGKIREWEVAVTENHSGTANIEVVHGEQNGVKQSKNTFISSGKNIGKANETSIFEQACSEAESKWNKQKDKGYGETVVESFRPMLAQSYADHAKKIIFPCYIQPKLDGLRCTISLEPDGRIVGRSRNGKEWKMIGHITDELKDFFKVYPYVLDGELFTRATNFQNIISGIKRDEPNEYTELVEFWCYDILIPGKDFELRSGFRTLVLSTFCIDKVVIVDTHKIYTHKQLMEKYEEFVSEGYEGAMARNAGSLYEPGKRSYNLQKIKKFIDEEFVIIDKHLDKNSECVFTCVTQEGKPFDVKPEGDHGTRLAYYMNDNIGQLLTVKFFEWTNDGVPRFPIGLRVRVEE